MGACGAWDQKFWNLFFFYDCYTLSFDTNFSTGLQDNKNLVFKCLSYSLFQCVSETPSMSVLNFVVSFRSCSRFPSVFSVFPFNVHINVFAGWFLAPSLLRVPDTEGRCLCWAVMESDKLFGNWTFAKGHPKRACPAIPMNWYILAALSASYYAAQWQMRLPLKLPLVWITHPPPSGTQCTAAAQYSTPRLRFSPSAKTVYRGVAGNSRFLLGATRQEVNDPVQVRFIVKTGADQYD